MQETTPTVSAPKPAAPSAAWLIAFFLILGAGLGYLVGQMLSQRALAIILGLAVGTIAAVIPALILIAATRHPAPAAPAAPPTPPTWGAPQPPVIQINLADLIAQRAALTPIPPQYLQLGQADGSRPNRVIGVEEWD
jgi:hypothetical protein